MSEEKYMDKGYCLECMTKHANRMEHHCEDIITASHNDPELRAKAQELLDQQRNIRKTVDDLRIQEIAKKQLQKTI